MGCGKDSDATGDAGIGAPGKAPDTVPSEEDMRKKQLEDEAATIKASKSSNR